MADRTSATIFGSMFERFASTIWLDHKLVREVWADARGHDFHPCQMDCHEALLTLGLAKVAADGEVIYKQADGETWEPRMYLSLGPSGMKLEFG